jgi:hypothetical protein
VTVSACAVNETNVYLSEVDRGPQQASIDDLLLLVKAVNAFDGKWAKMFRSTKSSILANKNCRGDVEFLLTISPPEG